MLASADNSFDTELVKALPKPLGSERDKCVLIAPFPITKEQISPRDFRALGPGDAIQHEPVDIASSGNEPRSN